MKKDELVKRLDAIESRLTQLEGRKVGAADLFSAIAEEALPSTRFGREFSYREHGSVGCQEMQACTHTPCRCRTVWGM